MKHCQSPFGLNKDGEYTQHPRSKLPHKNLNANVSQWFVNGTSASGELHLQQRSLNLIEMCFTVWYKIKIKGFCFALTTEANLKKKGVISPKWEKEFNSL